MYLFVERLKKKNEKLKKIKLTKIIIFMDVNIY